MEEFFDNLPYEDALDIEQAAKTIYELREQRAKILAGLAVADEAALLERIRSGALPEHPAYEQFLSASILDATREALRQQLAGELVRYNGSGIVREGGASFDFSPVYLKPQVEAACADVLEGEATAMLDALLLRLVNGVTVELRVFSAEHYCFSWLWGEALLRIDTAPLAESSGSHFHDLDGQRQPDPVTVPGDAPMANIGRLLKALAENPLLGS